MCDHFEKLLLAFANAVEVVSRESLDGKATRGQPTPGFKAGVRDTRIFRTGKGHDRAIQDEFGAATIGLDEIQVGAQDGQK